MSGITSCVSCRLVGQKIVGLIGNITGLDVSINNCMRRSGKQREAGNTTSQDFPFEEVLLKEIGLNEDRSFELYLCSLWISFLDYAGIFRLHVGLLGWLPHDSLPCNVVAPTIACALPTFSLIEAAAGTGQSIVFFTACSCAVGLSRDPCGHCSISIRGRADLGSVVFHGSL